jgi:hypothetical protein
LVCFVQLRIAVFILCEAAFFVHFTQDLHRFSGLSVQPKETLGAPVLNSTCAIM